MRIKIIPTFLYSLLFPIRILIVIPRPRPPLSLGQFYHTYYYTYIYSHW